MEHWVILETINLVKDKCPRADVFANDTLIALEYLSGKLNTFDACRLQ
jgi:hypothetical protein